MTLYLLSTAVSPVVSSHRTVRVFGVLAFLSFAAVYYFYANWFISVWCFFAALLSAVVYLHFVLRSAKPNGPRRTHATTVSDRSIGNSLSDHHS